MKLEQHFSVDPTFKQTMNAKDLYDALQDTFVTGWKSDGSFQAFCDFLSKLSIVMSITYDGEDETN